MCHLAWATPPPTHPPTNTMSGLPLPPSFTLCSYLSCCNHPGVLAIFSLHHPGGCEPLANVAAGSQQFTAALQFGSKMREATRKWVAMCRKRGKCADCHFLVDGWVTLKKKKKLPQQGSWIRKNKLVFPKLMGNGKLVWGFIFHQTMTPTTLCFIISYPRTQPVHFTLWWTSNISVWKPPEGDHWKCTLTPYPTECMTVSHSLINKQPKVSFNTSKSLPSLATWIYLYFIVAEVGVEGWRSIVTLHVPVCVCVFLYVGLSSRLTGLSVSPADQNTSLSVTGWSDSAAIQADSSLGRWWGGGGGSSGGGGVWARGTTKEE